MEIDRRRLAPGRLLLIRHAESDHNVRQRLCGWTDSPLSPRGIGQTRRLGAHLAAAYRLDRLYASPLQRAWLTAAAIAAVTGLAPEPVADLREIHFGELEGLPIDEIAARYPAVYAAWQVKDNLGLHYPGGESRRGFHQRVRAILGRIEAESHERVVAVVSHGGVIGSYLATRLAGDQRRWAEYAVRNCSITEVAWRGDELVAICHDHVDHLGDLIG